MTDPFKFELNKDLYIEITNKEYNSLESRYFDHDDSVLLTRKDGFWEFIPKDGDSANQDYQMPEFIFTDGKIFMLEQYVSIWTPIDNFQEWRESLNKEEKEAD